MKKISYIALLGLLLTNCSNHEPDVKIEPAKTVENKIDTHDERMAEIEKYTAILFEDSNTFNLKAATDLLAAYEVYIKHHGFETESKDVQFKAGELAKAMGKPHLAIKHFNALIERAPNHEKVPLALFYKAMIIGDDLHENELAKATYQEFVDKYPNHPFVESAKASILMQGKPLEEIVKEFEQKEAQ